MNTRRKGKQHSGPAFWALLMLAASCPSCSHHPVYPDYGSIQISSIPSGAEVVIDGQSTHRLTPCKIDGLAVGAHELTLREFLYRVLKQSITIEPAGTHRQNFRLEPVQNREKIYQISGGRDIAYDAVHQRLYVAGGSSAVRVYGADDSTLTYLYSVEGDTCQRLIAVSPAANRLFCLSDSLLAMVELNSPAVVRYLDLPGISGYTALVVSPDGNVVMAADSINKRLVLLDARLGSVIKFINLPAGPSDALFGPTGADAYVTLPQRHEVLRIDLASGVANISLPTGNAPGDLFWSLDHSYIGWCNRADKGITIASLANWSEATAVFGAMGGTAVSGACSTSEPVYLLAIISGQSSDALIFCYLPTWDIDMIVNSNNEKGKMIKICPSFDRRCYYVLMNTCVMAIQGDF